MGKGTDSGKRCGNCDGAYKSKKYEGLYVCKRIYDAPPEAIHHMICSRTGYVYEGCYDCFRSGGFD